MTEYQGNNVAVIDNGTGFTKMGFSGNAAPAYVVPTVYADNMAKREKKGLDDLDYLIGKDALDNYQNYKVTYPMKHGLIEDWDMMERLWHHCLYKYLRCNPEDHYVLLTEPPLNPPENRENTAEIMFETFGVKGLYIAVQAVLALVASWQSEMSKKKGLANQMTGTVIDSGDGVTHVIPVAEGYVINSCIKHIPLAGRDVTNFVQQMLRERQEPVPPEDILQLAQKIKEQHCYVCRDMKAEFEAYDQDPLKQFKQFNGFHPKTKAPYTVDIGYEQFLGPELFFTPEIFSADFTTPLPKVVDECIQLSPVDCRRGLYKNVVLSGGSTMYKNFRPRLQKDLTYLVKQRSDARRAKVKDTSILGEEIEVNVIAPPSQRYAVWFGGSQLADMPQFLTVVKTKKDYEEYGPSICRHNAAFNSSGK